MNDSSDPASLHLIWTETLAQLELSDPDGTAWQAIVTRYSEPHRHYHNLTHIAHCLELLQQTNDDTPLLRFAIFYHDIIYDTQSSNNELESAGFAVTELNRLGAAMSLATGVSGLILATDHSGRDPDLSPVARQLCDIDLAILGAPPDAYASYAEAIRREFTWVPDSDFRIGRAKVLQSFLDRDAIFLTPDYHRRCEAQARKNLRSELDALSRGAS